jgi:hypothetical protein
MQRPLHSALRQVLALLGATAAVTVVMSTGPAGAATPKHPGVMAPVSAKADCASGNVCLYPGDDGAGNPLTYYRYGAYNLSNQYGYHYIVNNQTGGAAFRLCFGYNGQRCGARLGPGSYLANLTPINSIVLEK